jgi:hypothetical protein
VNLLFPDKQGVTNLKYTTKNLICGVIYTLDSDRMREKRGIFPAYLITKEGNR